MADLRQNYTGVLVGAKGFTPPDGIGMASSQECYIGILRPNGRSIIKADFGNAKYESIDGSRVWTWSAPPYEGYPWPTTFYAAEIANAYFILGNDLAEFGEMIRSLTSEHNKSRANAGSWEPDGVNTYWIYRSIRGSEAMHIDGISNAVVLKFIIDSAMQSNIEIDTSNKVSKTNPAGLLSSETLHYELKEAGRWQASIPLSRDPATVTALFRVFSAFGFGVVL
jgi:hypothetical protein